MAVIPNHPLRLLRIERDLPAATLAAMCGVHRSTIQAIEEGVTRYPDSATVSRLAAALGVPTQELSNRLGLWDEEQRPPVLLGPAALKALQMSPAEVGSTFFTFTHWRKSFATSPTAFASLLGVNRKVVADYENGLKKRPGLPLSLASAMMRRLKVDGEYLAAVELLPTGDGAQS